MTSHPNGYGTQMVSLARLREIHEPKMHPEFARRLFAWLGKHDGIGIGGGFRTEPAPDGAPLNMSFHYYQQFRSGRYAYCAVDLVVADPPRVHRAPIWAESADAPLWGLHTFIKLPMPEPWHMQCIEMRGWTAWVNAGRPDPPTFALPVPPQPIIIVVPDEGEDMPAVAAIYAPSPQLAQSIDNVKTFLLRSDGGIRHAQGPDVEYANALNAKQPGSVPTLPIVSVEHYRALEVQSAQP